MKYIIIGLGNFGSYLSEQLTLAGNEIVGVDTDSLRTDNIKDKITTVITLDATNPSTLGMLPLKEVDMVIVAIGSDFGASVKVVSLLRKIGINNICARASDDVHEAVLESLGVEKILTPERDAAELFAQSERLGPNMVSYKISKEEMVVKVPTPNELFGKRGSDINFSQNFRLQLLSVLRPHEKPSFLGSISQHPSIQSVPQDDSFVFQQNDIMVLYGKEKDIEDFIKEF